MGWLLKPLSTVASDWTEKRHVDVCVHDCVCVRAIMRVCKQTCVAVCVCYQGCVSPLVVLCSSEVELLQTVRDPAEPRSEPGPDLLPAGHNDCGQTAAGHVIRGAGLAALPCSAAAGADMAPWCPRIAESVFSSPVSLPASSRERPCRSTRP